jgi:hypothetical protein
MWRDQLEVNVARLSIATQTDYDLNKLVWILGGVNDGC